MSGEGRVSGRSSRRRARLSAALFAALVLAAALVGPARRALSRTDPYLPPLLLVAGIGTAVARRASTEAPTRARRALRRVATLAGDVLARHGLTLSMVAFVIPVWAAWDLRPPGVTSRYAALFGRIPWSDAAGYHAGALRLLDRGTLDPFSQRRPVNAALLATRLAALDRDLGAATSAQALLAGVATWLAACAVATRYGRPCSLAFVGVALGFARPFLATTLSETLGYTLGCVGFGLILSGARPSAARFVAPAAVFALALAQGVRPGAVLVLPLLVASCVLVARRRRLALVSLTASVLIAAALPIALLRLHSPGAARPLSNFASIAVALASGERDWAAVLEARQQRLAGLTESDAAAVLYAEALDLTRRHPGRLLASLGRGASSYLRDLPAHLVETIAAPLGRWSAALLTGIAVIAALARVARGHAGPWWLWAAAAAGVLLSAPFVHEAGGMRVFASTDPVLAGFLALGAARSSPRRAAGGPAWGRHDRMAATLLAFITLGALVGPTAARAATPVPYRLPMPPDGSLVLGRPISVIVGASATPCRGVRVVTRRAFREGIDLTGEGERLAARRPPFAFAGAYDPERGVDRYFVGPISLACADAAFLFVHTQPFLDSRTIEEVTSFEVLPPREPAVEIER